MFVRTRWFTPPCVLSCVNCCRCVVLVENVTALDSSNSAVALIAVVSCSLDGVSYMRMTQQTN